MTPTQRSQMRVGVVTAVVGGLMLLAFTKLTAQIVLRPEFEAHEAKIEHKLDRILDAVCTDKPSARPCK